MGSSSALTAKMEVRCLVRADSRALLSVLEPKSSQCALIRHHVQGANASSRSLFGIMIDDLIALAAIAGTVCAGIM